MVKHFFTSDPKPFLKEKRIGAEIFIGCLLLANELFCTFADPNCNV